MTHTASTLILKSITVKLLIVVLVLFIPALSSAETTEEGENTTSTDHKNSDESVEIEDKGNNRLDYPLSKTHCIGCIVSCTEEESCEYAI